MTRWRITDRRPQLARVLGMTTGGVTTVIDRLEGPGMRDAAMMRVIVAAS